MGDDNRLSKVLRDIYRRDSLERPLSRETVNLADADGRTPLMHAILAEDADPSIVQKLILSGAEVDAVDHEQNWTALHFAARDQNNAITKMLIENGANVDAINVRGETPLWLSVMYSTSNVETVKSLVSAGADVHRKDSRGIAPVDLARDRGREDLTTILTQHSNIGATPPDARGDDGTL